MTKVPLALRLEWAAKLATSGFIDIEDVNGRLKQNEWSHPRKDSRKVKDQETTREFFQLLDQYLSDTELNRLERRILELHSQGEKLEPISLSVYRSLAYVKNCIYKHRKIILHRK